MKRLMVAAVAVFAISLLMPDDASAQRGRGGGGRMGGGGMGGGMSRAPSMGSYNRSPSMSRAASPSMYRPQAAPANRPQNQVMNRPQPAINRGVQSGNFNRPATAGNFSGNRAVNQGGINRQTTGGVQRSGNFATGQQGIRSAQSYQRPSQQSVNNFLNMPPNARTTGATSRSGTASTLPAGNGSGNSGSRTFTTEGGGTVTVGGAGGRGTTSGGAQAGGGVAGIHVETAGGQTFSRVGGVAGATDGTNSAIRGGSATGISDGQGNAAANIRGGTAVSDGTNTAVRGGSVTGARDSQGNAGVNVRGGYADSSGYRQGGSLTATQNAAGVTRVNASGGYGYGNGTGRTGSVSAVRGPGGNVIASGHGATYVNGQFVGGQTWSAVNGNYTHWNSFGPGYPTYYPNCWWPGKWAVATTAWATATYAVAGSYCGCGSEAVYYDYGENVVYEEGAVVIDGEPVATAEEYYGQAAAIADTAAESTDEDWMPLGVFSIVSDGQTNSEKVVQLALNREGAIRGNYQDLMSDKVTPVEGAVDKETQRVAIRLEGNPDLVVETGLYNLTNDEVPILIHFDATRQENRKLIRLDRPEDLPPAE